MEEGRINVREPNWVEAVDTSRLISVVDLTFHSSGARYLVEFIALEVRELGAVATLRIVDNQNAASMNPTDFVVPTLEVNSSVGQEFEAQVIANDFLDLHSVRHRAVITPRPQGGSRLTISVTGLDPTAADAVWTSKEVTTPLTDLFA